jgi:hypothetical protein
MTKRSEPAKQKEKINRSNNPENVKIEQVLIENFVSLQKVMTTLAVKFDGLSNQISKLLELFEISAKTLAERGYLTEDNKKVVEKLDNLLEHNKVIAKGIALLHEKEPVPQEYPRQQYAPQQIRKEVVKSEAYVKQPANFSPTQRFDDMSE